MTRRAIFDATAKQLPGIWNRPGAIAIMDEALERLEKLHSAAPEAVERDSAPARSPTALKEPQLFYGLVRGEFGPLEQSQVDGFDALLAAMGAAHWPVAWAAYGLATAWHETARTMRPVEEAYWVRNAEDWRRRNLRYYPWHGRGYVQLTWEANYRWADKELGLNGALLQNRDLAMEPGHAATIMVRGMEQGAFAKTHSLRRHLPESPAALVQFREARRIINGVDKADEIARHALKFQAALQAGGWA